MWSKARFEKIISQTTKRFKHFYQKQQLQTKMNEQHQISLKFKFLYFQNFVRPAAMALTYTKVCDNLFSFCNKSSKVCNQQTGAFYNN